MFRMKIIACLALLLFYPFFSWCTTKISLPGDKIVTGPYIKNDKYFVTESVNSHDSYTETVDTISNGDRSNRKQIDLTPCEIKPIMDLYVAFNVSRTSLDVRHQELTGATPIHPDIISYVWEMGDGYTHTGSEFVHNYNIANKPGEYTITLTVTNDVGCTKTASKTIPVDPFIPNVFTPNGDGINDLFMPSVALQVIDRYGRVIYRGTEGWDGTYKGKIADRDTYFYLIDFVGMNNKVQTHKGYITLEK